MADINLNNLDGIPFGKNAGRPANPQPGQPYFNGEANRLEIYTESVGWQNIVQETPAVVSIVGTAKESTSSTVTVNGTNFAVGAIAYAVGSNNVEYAAVSTSLVSVVELLATFPGLSPAYEPYDIKVVNPSNLYGVLYECLNVDATPVWTTGSGSLGTYIEQSPMSIQVTATDVSDPTSSALIYSISSGSLPSGLSINSATGVISGTPENISSPTTYSFTANAYDGMNNSYRNFSITVTDRGPTWVTSTALPTFTKGASYSTTLSATDEDSVATISYSLFSGSLPSGLSLASNGVISGTPAVNTSASFTIRATDSVSSSYSDKQFTMTQNKPDAPTITSVSATTNSIASISFAAPSYTGTSTITGYTAVSSPGGFSGSVSQSGSGSINVSGLTAGTSYTFVVYATNSAGNSLNSSASNSLTMPNSPSTVDYLVVAGGGGGGTGYGGGGGAGGYRTGTLSISSLSNSIVVGGGGAGGANSTSGTNGSNSQFGSISSSGGGGGGYGTNGNNGGSGGGGGHSSTGRSSGNIGGYSPVEGYGGGQGYNSSSATAGAGGGASASGGDGVVNSNGPAGGAGASSSITGSAITYAGGGGGGVESGSYSGGAGGSGGGGTGGRWTTTVNGTAGTTNLGGGGGGGGPVGGNGGSGVVIIAYPNSYLPLNIPGGLTYDQPTRSGYRVYRFTAGTGTVTWG